MSKVIEPYLPYLVRVIHEDSDGRLSVVLVPEGRESESERGILVGPPDLSPLNLPEDIEIALQNQLVNRNLLTQQSLRGRGHEVVAALQSALKVSANRVMQLYTDVE